MTDNDPHDRADAHWFQIMVLAIIVLWIGVFIVRDILGISGPFN